MIELKREREREIVKDWEGKKDEAKVTWLSKKDFQLGWRNSNFEVESKMN